MRRKIFKIYGIALLVAVIYLVLVLIFDSGFPCFYKSTTGLICPGCGTTDMMLALTELRIADAFFCNPLIFCSLIVWNGVAVFYFVKNRATKADRCFLRILVIISIVATVFFTVFRNLIY